MPTSVVHAAVALLLAVGLLGQYYDRRALAVVLAVVLFPELDAAVGFVMNGAHRTVFHTLVTSVVAAGLLYWETQRPNSWVRGRWGTAGVRIAWVGVFVHTFAHLGLDWAHLSGINIVWPLVDQFFYTRRRVIFLLDRGRGPDVRRHRCRSRNRPTDGRRRTGRDNAEYSRVDASPTLKRSRAGTGRPAVSHRCRRLATVFPCGGSVHATCAKGSVDAGRRD